MMLPSYYDAIRPLPDEQRLALYDAIMDYAFGGKEPENLSPILKGYFVLLRPNIDSSAKRYAASVENGKKGGRPKKEPGKKASKNPAETQEKPGENQDKDKEREKDREMETETETDDVESAPPALSPPPAPPVIGLPLNDGTEYGVTEEQCQEWAELYPAVDVLQELRKMRGWLDSNKARRKTKRGISRFITNWLAREQDRGRGGRSDGERRETHGAVSGTGGGQGQPAKKWGVPVVEL